ncbi:MAG: hypothetical protein ABL878_19445, partial [Burkholderiales bacterium]
MAMTVRYNTVNGEIVSETRGGVKSFYVKDVLGSTIALTDNTGTITDRIGLFGALAHNERHGESAVFVNRDNAVRLNLDYAAAPRSTIYIGGEFRRGDVVSSTRNPSLEDFDIAKVLARDDAYPGGQFFTYRFDGSTVITTVGYNLGFGPRDSIDFSWRRVESTPSFRPSFATSPRSYIAIGGAFDATHRAGRRSAGRGFAGTAGVLVMTLFLASCGGGGGGYSGDVSTSAPPSAVVSGVNSFLLFPNPQLQADGTVQMNSPAYAQAYYAAIDPTNARSTLAAWKALNGFGTGGNEVTVVFGDVRDLGYGRRMTARQNVDGTVAVMVENYLVNPAAGYTYNPFNLDAAVLRDARWNIGTNAIEFSPAPGAGVSFAKFFSFDPVTGARLNSIDMDGRGEKAMPGPCISCHGGRGDPLTPPDPVTGNPLFALVPNSVALIRGDVQGHLHPLEADTFDFSTTSPYTRAEQETAIKAINRMVLCTYPIPAPAGGEDVCRRTATVNEWQGTAAQQIKNAYGGNGLPSPIYSNTTIPNAFLVAGQSSLYTGALAPACRACHILRGTGNQSDIDFEDPAKVQGYGERIKVHVYDRGNMPLVRLIADLFFSTSMADIMANFLGGLGFTVRDSGGAVLLPGRPVADPGPDRVVLQGATMLSAAASQFSTNYQWSIVSGPMGAVLSNATAVQPTFTTIADGTYVLQLITSSGAVQS